MFGLSRYCSSSAKNCEDHTHSAPTVVLIMKVVSFRFEGLRVSHTREQDNSEAIILLFFL